MSITKILTEKARRAIVPDNWKIRRRWMKWFIFWLGGNAEAMICWTIYAGGNAMIVQMFLTVVGAMIAILMFYIFGAVFDDHSKRRFNLPAESPDDNQEDSPAAPELPEGNGTPQSCETPR
jgi:bacteriorhodopsin